MIYYDINDIYIHTICVHIIIYIHMKRGMILNYFGFWQIDGPIEHHEVTGNDGELPPVWLVATVMRGFFSPPLGR